MRDTMRWGSDSDISSKFVGNVLWEFVFDNVICARRTVGYKYGIRFEIRPKENGHNVPHCHACYGNQNISISLIDFKVLAGNIPKNRQKIAVDWVRQNIDILRKHWNEYHCLEV